MKIIEIKKGWYKATLNRVNGQTIFYGTDRIKLIMSLIEEAYN